MHPVTEELINKTLMVNDEHFGQRFVGTREDFHDALKDEFPSWYRDYQGALDVDDDGMSFEEYVESSLDKHLSLADDDDLADCERL